MVRFEIEDDSCRRLYAEEKGAERYPAGVVDAFFEALEVIHAAADIRDLYRLKAFHVEKLRGKKWKRGERSIRLNDQYRLVFRMEKDKKGSFLVVMNVVDYH